MTPHSSNGRPFIPAWLDDQALRPSQFRVLCHLWRRAGKNGKCYPAARSIAKTCRITRDTVWEAIAGLESLGLLKREKGSRNSNRYTLIVGAGVGGNDGPTPSVELAETEGHQSAEKKGRVLAETEGQVLAEKKGREGSPMKVLQRSVPMGGGANPLDDLPESLSEFEVQKVAESLEISTSDVVSFYAEFRRIKIGYRSDWVGSARTDLPGLFQTFLESDSRGKKFVRGRRTELAIDYSRFRKPGCRYMKHVTITTDGSCHRNPGGRGGYAAILRCGSAYREISGHQRRSTNNEMEFRAMVEGLSLLREPCRVLIRTDSKVARSWAVNSGKAKFTDNPKFSHITDLILAFRTFASIHRITLVLVKGHAGDPDNTRADRLASRAAHSGQPTDDRVSGISDLLAQAHSAPASHTLNAHTP